MLLETLEALESNPAAYRAAVILIMTVIVNVCGYIENRAAKKGLPYDKRKIAETLMVYTPLIALLPELLPMNQAIVGALIIDIFRRTISHLKGETEEA
ncbi:unnamed protein product [marine sediment metagenome]|uniref:Uncharacterized protein n=1 Tax=marine sediment metagenome TaxID=412755 RepID=X1Q137_9ZZZZ